jgi:branched-chain amino acid transport system substrate-binding protein
MGKRILFLGIIVVLFVVFLAYFNLPIQTGFVTLPSQNSGQVQIQAITIGAVLPLTGTAASLGQDARQGIELALAESDGVNVLFEDSQNDAKIAVTAAKKLVFENNIRVLISWLSASSSAIAPVANDNNVVLIYGSAIDAPAKKFPFVFKDHLNITVDCALLAKYLRGKKGAALAANNESTLSCIEEFKAAGFDLKPELYLKGETDFRSSLEKISARKPDFILIRTFSDETPMIFKQMSELGIEGITLVCPTAKGVHCDDEKVISQFSRLLKGAIGTDFFLDKKNTNVMAFEKAFEKKFSKKPGTEAVFAFETILILSQAARPCVGNPDLANCLKENLQSMEFDSLYGKKSFDSDGVFPVKTTLLQFNGEKWVAVENQD